MALVGKTFVTASGVAMTGLYIAYQMQARQKLHRLLQQVQDHEPGPMEKQYLTFLLGGGSVSQIQAAMKSLLKEDYLFDVDKEGPNFRDGNNAHWFEYGDLLQSCRGLAQPTASLPDFIREFLSKVGNVVMVSNVSDMQQGLLSALRNSLDQAITTGMDEEKRNGTDAAAIKAKCIQLQLINKAGVSAPSLNRLKNHIVTLLDN
jgi:hypothetical protein